MADIKTEQEPSIEEILESIRQIISEDGSEEEKVAAKPAPTAAPQKPQPQPAKVMQQQPPKPPAKPAENILDLTDKVVPEEEPVAEPEVTIELEDIPERPPQPQKTAAVSSGDDLLSDAAVDAASAAMSKLMSTNIAVESHDPSRIGSVTLEDMVREMMRPLVKTWLDRNLPGIIERMVQREIEKVSRRAMDR